MYTITRQEAAAKLGMSTRSIDRYIKSGKLRSKKDGKIIYIHSQDIDNISGGAQEKKPEVIIPQEKLSYQSTKKENPKPQSTDIMNAQSRATLEKIYLDMRSEIKTKDQTIQDLAIKLGQSQEIAKNSVSLIEFKKSQFLLEESKNHITLESNSLRKNTEELTRKLKYEKSTNYILIIFCIILMIGLGFMWFLKI